MVIWTTVMQVVYAVIYVQIKSMRVEFSEFYLQSQSVDTLLEIPTISLAIEDDDRA